MQRTENFNDDEFRCKHCGKLPLDRIEAKYIRFVEKLQIARTHSGVPYNIINGHRCSIYNRKVGGVHDSAHLDIAADIEAKDSRTRMKIVAGLVLAGFDRIGVMKNAIHVDDELRKTPWVMWLYRWWRRNPDV